MKSCETCTYFAKKGGVYWCVKKNYSTSPNGGAFCTYFKRRW